MQNTRLFLIAILIAGWCCFSIAQDSYKSTPEADARFDEGIHLYTAGKYSEAADIFNSLIALHPVHQRTTASYLMAAKSYLNIRAFDRASFLLKEFLSSYPDSKFRVNAYYTLGTCEFLNHQYAEAAVTLYRVKEMSKHNTEITRSEELLESIAGQNLTMADLDKIPSTSDARHAREYLLILMARDRYGKGEYEQAKTLIDTLIAGRPDSLIAGEALALKSKIGKGVRLRVGAILPLFRTGMSPAKQLAQEMLDGMNLALDEKNPSLSNGLKITLDVRDVERDNELAKRMLKELSAETDVVGVLGPMFSNIAFDCASVASEERIPLVSPTANARGIAAKSPYMFQLNPDLSRHGKALAQYAVMTLGLKKLAILTPSDSSLKLLVEEFYQEAIRDGAEVLTVEVYDDAADDLEAHFKHLRMVGLGGEPQVNFGGKFTREQLAALRTCGVHESTIDSLKKRKSTIGVLRLLGPYGLRIADSLKIPVNYPSVNSRDLNVALTGIEGLFAPVVEAENINILYSQLAYYNIKTQILGSAEWYDLNILESNKQAADGAIFCSDTYIDRDNPAVKRFGEECFDKTKKFPTRYTIFGYDAMNLLVRLIADGNTTREKLASALTRTGEFKGLHSTIMMDDSRVNSILNILQYKNRAISKIGEVAVH
jgi:ABC-type branched-subunit amino acid transport system substrate-binding protein